MKSIITIIQFYFLAFIITISLQSYTQQYITTTMGSDLEMMVGIIKGNGIQYSNVSYLGHSDARGTFFSTINAFELNSGIYLCSGSGDIIPGLNSSDQAGWDNGQPGHPYLGSISPVYTTNAAILEFDIIPQSDSLVCSFIFGGEEYNEWVYSNDYGDLCAIFIEGPGYSTFTNIALVPDTTLYVGDHTINNGYAPPWTPTSGPCSFCEYYIDNTYIPGYYTYIEYDGFTTKLLASAIVISGEQYHVTIGIADGGSPEYDSGIFIGEESLKTYGRSHIIEFSFNAELNPLLTETIEGIIYNDTIFLTLPTYEIADSLVASFVLSSGAKAHVNGELQISDTTVNDFTEPVTYHVEGWLGTFTDWPVKIYVQPDILYFAFEQNNNPALEQDYIGTINNSTIVFDTINVMDSCNLIATYELSYGANAYVIGVIQESGITVNDFSNPVNYIISNENDLQKVMEVLVNFQINDESNIIEYGFDPALNPGILEYAEGVIEDNTINVYLPEGTDVTDLIASFSLSDQAEAYIDTVWQQSGITTNDFTTGKIYVVEAGNGAVSSWVVLVHLITNIADNIVSPITFYPNPAGNKLFVQNVENAKVQLVSLSGNALIEFISIENNTTLDLTGIPAGIYILKVETNNQTWNSKVLIIK